MDIKCNITTLIYDKQDGFNFNFSYLCREMTKITNRNQYHKSYRKYKPENGHTWTSEYTCIGGGTRCHRGVSISCLPVAPAMRPISSARSSSQYQCVKIRETKQFAIKISTASQLNRKISSENQSPVQEME
jgi:hypothetical protein